ncbi:MAG: hypothetical protein ACLBM6_07805, partial [Cuspidothrix sp.]
IMIAKARGKTTAVKKLACIINFVKITNKHHIRLLTQKLHLLIVFLVLLSDIQNSKSHVVS